MAIIDPKKYFTTIIAALIIIGVAIGALIHSIFARDEVAEAPLESDVYLMGTESANDLPVASPHEMGVPDHPPFVPAPTVPPPGV